MSKLHRLSVFLETAPLRWWSGQVYTDNLGIGVRGNHSELPVIFHRCPCEILILRLIYCSDDNNISNVA